MKDSVESTTVESTTVEEGRPSTTFKRAHPCNTSAVRGRATCGNCSCYGFTFTFTAELTNCAALYRLYLTSLVPARKIRNRFSGKSEARSGSERKQDTAPRSSSSNHHSTVNCIITRYDRCTQSQQIKP